MVIMTNATVTSGDPNMRLKFQNVIQGAKVSGIEILPTSGSTPISATPKPVAIVSSPTSKPTVKPIPRITNMPAAASTSNLTTVRINSGSFKTYTDPDGNQWSADVSFNGGGRHNGCPESIANTNLDDVYCNERNWGGAVGFNGTYTIAVKPGLYEVRLHFAEIFFDEPNQRIFNVYVQDRLVRTNLDIFAETGGEDIAMVVSTIATVTSADPFMRLKFQKVKQNAKVSGIEILPNAGGIPTSTTAPKTLKPSTAPKSTAKPTQQKPQQNLKPSIAPKSTAKPTKKPSSAPVSVSSPSFKPIALPTSAPTTSSTFQSILINCGYNQPYTDSLAREWTSDKYFFGGNAASKVRSIENTVDDLLYHFERVGEPFFYEIPVPVGVYKINLFFSENEYTAARQRLFDISVEGRIESDVDIFQMAGAAFTATRLQFISIVEDGFLTILFRKSRQFPNSGLPKLSAIEVILDKPHISHAVASGPYIETVTDSTIDKANVQLLGQTSHTHGDGLNLEAFTWKEGNTILGTAVNINYAFSVGNHTISLTVIDDGGNSDTEVTSVSINRFGFPAITSLDPSTGTLAGGYPVIIRGTGFTYSAQQTTVTFGTTVLTGSAITIVSSTSIRVAAPTSGLALNTAVIVRTPLGSSNPSDFTYQGFPIQWQEGKLLEFDRPPVGRFGPDGKLYVGTRKGRILKVSMNEDDTSVVNTIVSLVNDNSEETILGIAMDPLDTKGNPDVYFTMNGFFHKGKDSSSGTTIAGKIRRASGANLEAVVDIITGLPVSGLDHGLNALEFLDDGSLLFTSGSHTNGGKPGKLSSSGVLKENFLSGSVGIAYLSHPDFRGEIKWSAPDDGNMIATGIDLFAMGLRNPFGLVLHTNGYVYGTDNGPNKEYGRMLTGCNGDSVDDQNREDEINLLEKGKYYGHPNLKRASYFNDPRQCVWRSPETPDSLDHTAPLMTHKSSIDGILEFHGNHFGGQLRHNLIYIRYQSVQNIFRIALTPDGRSILPSLNRKGISMNIGNLGLDLTQAPNGNLVEMRYGSSSVYYYKPVEPQTSALLVKTCWPRRGHKSGGTPLTIYGVNLNTRSATVTVTVGASNCPVISASATKVVCKLPGGVGSVDILVTNGDATSTFENGYRYISGVLPTDFKVPVYSG